MCERILAEPKESSKLQTLTHSQIGWTMSFLKAGLMYSSSLVIQMTKVVMMIRMIQEMVGNQLQIHRQQVIWP